MHEGLGARLTSFRVLSGPWAFSGLPPLGLRRRETYRVGESEGAPSLEEHRKQEAPPQAGAQQERAGVLRRELS